ncbi:MAG: UDP-GlcNAc:undecaprenyl-phosphate GlcNAc-1-phosphate transferase [Lentisphaeria bacterium]
MFNIWGKPQYKRIKKVFMGDAGSMFLGLVVGVIIIQGSQKSAPAFLPVTALWLVLLPMTDMFTIMYRRMRRGKSPMAPDRTHIHHILLRAGFSKTSTLFVMVLMQVFCVLMGVLTAKTGFSEVQSFSLLVVTVMAYQLFIRNSWKLIRWNKRRLLSQAQILLTQ